MKNLTSLTLLLACFLSLYACENKAKVDDAEKSEKLSEEELEAARNRSYKKENKGSKTSSEFTLKDGKMEGMAIQRYQGGSVWKKSPYKNGKLHGKAEVYDRQGRLKRSVEYSEGEYDGIYTKYFKSGKVKAKLQYNEGLPLPGIEEYDYTTKLVEQPTIEVREHDQLLKEGKYYFYIELDEPEAEKIYVFLDENDWRPGNPDMERYQLELKDGVGVIPLEVEKGMRWQGSLYIFATYRSKYGLEAVVTRRYEGDVLHF